MYTRTKISRDRRGEASFTLLETIVALGLLTFLILEVAGVQGHAVVFSDYGRSATKATWLAKRVLARVEYEAESRPFKELDVHNVKDVAFEDQPDFTYSLEIKDWKLPLLDMITNGGPKKDDDEGPDTNQQANPQSDMIKSAVKNVLGDELLKTVDVEVSWAEGAQRDSVSLSYLLTNQQKVDEVLGQLKAMTGGLPGGAGGAGNGSPQPTPPGGTPQQPNSGAPNNPAPASP